MILQKKFPKSPRIAVLHGLRREAEGDYDGAKMLYAALLGLNLDGAEKGKGKAPASVSTWRGERDETFIVSRCAVSSPGRTRSS